MHINRETSKLRRRSVKRFEIAMLRHEPCLIYPRLIVLSTSPGNHLNEPNDGTLLLYANSAYSLFIILYQLFADYDFNK